MKLPELPQELTDFQPEIALILGSGLGFFADDRIEVLGRLPYTEIAGFPVSTVPGHAGQFVFGTLEGKRVLCMQGRFHFYEGYTMSELTLPIRLMHRMGVHTLFVTNAAGGINRDYVPGDFMLLSDHINFLGTNPLIGWQGDAGVRFPDMTEVYNGALRAKIREWALAQRVDLKEGVYLATTGPSFETPAEIRAFAALGADAVGMSTVPEAIVARKFGMRVLGISCITNAAAGISETELSHEEVAETADRVRVQFADLLAAGVQLA
ncbi:purine-nucleoside phosphorylase [Coraliomargarita sp. SDUM461004]|uniref:Purine nucleoside phosphorylase n=2 Tax=Thalassobacterium sedimentorum TaxID=3041258 RepID=A0ABU1AFF6_9BACT|nr:purine-nucleoside phosphorylase [Coraliomargarita sp. SDUM461004]MDQ8193562.1 purine-nucleoside phosphorylase [Coraliomargarita sp. SDUM461004]